LIEIRLHPDGTGEGKMSIATKVSFNEKQNRRAGELRQRTREIAERQTRTEIAPPLGAGSPKG
jgi:hypothetical protein